MPDIRKANELDDAIRTSPALIAHHRIEAIAHAHYVFRRNYQELKNALDKGTDPGSILPIHDVRRRGDLDIVLMEVRRLLHNFLAAAKTVIDQTRVIITDGYRDHTFFERYKKEIQVRFATEPTANFVQDLRNYLLHYGLPATFSRITLSSGIHADGQTIDAKITLSTDSLLSWDGWSQPSRDLLKKAGRDVDLEETARTYAASVDDFHQWLTAELTDIHSVDLAWLEDMSRQLREALGDPDRKSA